MKKICASILLSCSLLILSGCGENEKELQSTIDSQSKEIQDLKKKNNTLKKEVTTQIKKSKNLNDTLDDKNKEINTLKKNISDKSNKINTLEESKKNKDETIEKLENKLKNKEKQIIKLGDELESQENNISSLRVNQENNSDGYDDAPNKTNKQLIRGNTESKIYHSPGQRDYDNMANSENLIEFNSPQEAEAAGYRAAKR